MSWGASVRGIGNVVSAFDAVRTRFDGDTVYIVGPTVEYAVYQDQGTSSIEARPFVKPAAERVQNNLRGKAGQFLDPTADLTEHAVVKAVALAVEREMKQIVREKDIWDLGTLHASIGAVRVK
jgi:hypothetical protein